MEKMGIGDFLHFGFENAKKHFFKFFGSILLSVVFLGVLAGIGFALNEGLGVLLLLVGIISVSMGFMQNIILLAKGESFDLKAFIPQPAVFLNYFIAMMIVSIVVAIGLALLVIPGLILGVMFSLVPYLILDQKMGAIEAIKESMSRTKGHKNDIFWGLIVSNIVASLLSTFVITLFFTTPMLYFISAYPYLRLTGKLELIPDEEETIVVNE
ncbi:MAG: hypothetical protein J7K89_05155 [Candidatus Cloacimonetes bacterium]|nr:hypothetical protein [Candidatus Cloacimonadota bacterium]